MNNSSDSPTQTVKLQAFLAHAGIASRRKAEALIEEGVVKVNGQTAHVGQRIDPLSDKIEVSGKPIQTLSELTYFLINKPQGYVSTTNDELGRKTVLTLIPEHLSSGLYPVGRLDADSEGLLLLTNDGELTHIFTHPSRHVEKTYLILLAGIPSTKALDHLKRGVKLKEGYFKPLRVTIKGHEEKNTWIEVVIGEGKKHQIRRMMSRIGYDVLRLIRQQMGPLQLGDLKTGKYRSLTAEELKTVEDLKKKARES